MVITSYELASNIVSANKHVVEDENAKCDELFNGKRSERPKAKPKFGVVILDESHYIKSEKAKRAKAARSK